MEDRSLKIVRARWGRRAGEPAARRAIGVGGDGSLDILRRLMARSHRLHRHPKTIDTDVANTERAVLSTASHRHEALRRLHPTGASHERVMVLEVMGETRPHRHRRGIAGAADVVLIPECVASGTRGRAYAPLAHGRRSLGAGRGGGGPGSPTTRSIRPCTDRRLAGAPAQPGDGRGGTRHGAGPRPARPPCRLAEDRLLASALGVRAVEPFSRRQGRPHGGVVKRR